MQKKENSSLVHSRSPPLSLSKKRSLLSIGGNLKRKREEIDLNLKIFNSHSLKISCPPNATVLQLKQLIQREAGLGLRDQILIYRRRYLLNAENVQEVLESQQSKRGDFIFVLSRRSLAGWDPQTAAAFLLQNKNTHLLFLLRLLQVSALCRFFQCSSLSVHSKACFKCEKKIYLATFQCTSCHRHFCSDHRFPETHSCKK